MRLSEICVERPVFASVLSLLILLLGAIALLRLPNRELPDVDAPVVSVTTIFPAPHRRSSSPPSRSRSRTN